MAFKNTGGRWAAVRMSDGCWDGWYSEREMAEAVMAGMAEDYGGDDWRVVRFGDVVNGRVMDRGAFPEHRWHMHHPQGWPVQARRLGLPEQIRKPRG